MRLPLAQVSWFELAQQERFDLTTPSLFVLARVQLLFRFQVYFSSPLRDWLF
jgi:hypothetical protein